MKTLNLDCLDLQTSFLVCGYILRKSGLRFQGHGVKVKVMWTTHLWGFCLRLIGSLVVTVEWSSVASVREYCLLGVMKAVPHPAYKMYTQNTGRSNQLTCLCLCTHARQSHRSIVLLTTICNCINWLEWLNTLDWYHKICGLVNARLRLYTICFRWDTTSEFVSGRIPMNWRHCRQALRCLKLQIGTNVRWASSGNN